MRKVVLVSLAVMLTSCGKEGESEGKPVSYWRQALRDQNPKTRRAAAAALGKAGTEARDAVPELAGALKDPDEGVRVKAANALWSIGEVAQDSPTRGVLIYGREKVRTLLVARHKAVDDGALPIVLRPQFPPAQCWRNR